MPVLAPVYVQNNMPGPTTMSSDPKGTLVVDWAGKGDPTGNDIQPIPAEMLNLPQFTRALQRKVLSLVEDMSDPAMVEALQKQSDSWAARTSAAAASAVSSIEHVASNDFIQLDCIGPNARGAGLCGNPVSVRERQKETAPALCEIHKDLAPEYVPETRFEGDETHTRWIRTVMSPRQIGEQS